MATKNLSEYNAAKVPDASNMIFGIVVSEWNPEITGALLEGCVSTLEKHGALPENIHVKTVPGSFELIYGARQMTLNDGYDAVIVLGCVIRGETPHFDYICQGVTQGIARLNATNNIPVVFGLLTTENMQQAQDRAGGRLDVVHMREVERIDERHHVKRRGGGYGESARGNRTQQERLFHYRQPLRATRLILPLIVLGSSSLNSTIRGYL